LKVVPNRDGVCFFTLFLIMIDQWFRSPSSWQCR